MSTSVGNPPVNHGHSDSVNGRNPTIPAVPSAPSNGNSSFPNDHKRTPSMTVTPAGTTSFNANGAPQNKSNIQFGSVNAGNSGSSPAMGTPPPSVHQSSTSLGVNSLNPRMPSPSNSPSPIPQPVQVSGGRPPSGVQGAGSSMSFGQFGGDTSDPNGLNRPMSQMHLGQEHMRRGSSQSIHSDMAGTGLPTGPGRGGYPVQGGRGRGGYQNTYPNQMSHSPQHTFRPNHPNGRGSFQNRGGHQMGYQGSPSMQPRTPMFNPGTPQMNHMPMVQGQQYGYGQYQGYGNVPITADPSISYNSQAYFYPQGGQFPPYGAPPQSPRPFQQPGYATHMQTSYSSQGQGPQSMSRQSSQMSTAERPSSSIGQTPQTPASIPHHGSARTPSMSGDVVRPPKKSAAIPIKNALGEVVDFKKQQQQQSQQQQPPPPPPPSSQPPPASPAPTSTPAVATPPSRTDSAADNTHGRTESQNLKNDEEKKKAMQEAVARKIAEEKEQEARKLKEAEDEKARMEKEAAQAAEREAQARKEEAERLEREAKEAEEKSRKAEEEAAAAKQASAPPEDEKHSSDEIDLDALAAEMEAEEAAREAEELRREEEYMKKKAVQKEAERKREEEKAAAYEASMKEMERKAEEEELAREKKRQEGGDTSDDEAKRLFAQLKSGGTVTPGTGDDSPAPTPGESGAATPISDASMGPPGKGLGANRRNKAAPLVLDTKNSVEPPEPSATLRSLTSARMLDDPSKVNYPSGFVSPNPALNANAPADRKFKYNKEFLLQFQNVFKEKPSLDWDQKIRDALGDGDSARPQTARTPSGMGPRGPSNRPPPNTGFQMGAFGRQTLPPGTTSEQRFAASNATMGRGGPMANPFAFGRPGSMGPPMGRTPSNNPLGGIPGSPRVSGASRGGSRAESKRAKQNAKQEAESNKSMPLTAGMQIGALEISSTGWKARSLGQGPVTQSVGLDGYMEADVVQRKVKAALNKMTPEKFERISDQILEIAAQSKHETDGRTLRQVIQLVFEKATDEAHWAPMYAKFCFKMLSNMSNEIKDEGIKDKNGNVVAGGNLFRKYLLNRCQEEFERGWKVNLPGREEGQTEEAAMMSDEYYEAAAAKRRGLGLVKFIGELFKLGMLTERIMHECVKKLLDYEGTPDEAEVESLSSLLRTIGRQLDSPESRAAGRMDAYFERIEATIKLPDLPSRLKFMLMDISDLRRAGWDSKDDDKGPKTIQQIHEEAEARKREEEMQKLASQAGRGGGGRMPLGRGDARSFSGYGQVPPPDNSNRVGAEDLRRLGGRTQRQSTTPSGSFGPSGLGARTNSGRRGLGPNLSRPDESNASSRTGTPPAQKDKDKKDESSTNAFSALAGLSDGHDVPASPPSNPSSPPTQKSQPIERERSRSPEKNTE